MADTFTSGCGGPSIIWRDDGYIEIIGRGVPKNPLPKDGAPGWAQTLSGMQKSPQGLEQWKDLIWKHALRTYDQSSNSMVPAAYIAAIIAVESRGQANAINFGDTPHGAGLMQITDASLRKGLSDEQLIDPDTNIQIGTDYLLHLFNTYGGNLIRVAAAYNNGSASCGAHGQCDPNEWNLKTYCPPCDPNRKPKTFCPPEDVTTPNYVGTVLSMYNSAMDHGFGPGDAPVVAPSTPPIAVASAVGNSAGALVIGAVAIGIFVATLYGVRRG